MKNQKNMQNKDLKFFERFFNKQNWHHFLDAATHFYKRVCPSVRWSVFVKIIEICDQNVVRAATYAALVQQ